MPKYLSNTTFFSDNLGTYIANGEIETNKLTTNGDIILTGSITNGSNSITFTENTLYTNIPENFYINGTGLIQYQGVNYNIGQILSAFVGGGTISPYPSITYDASLNQTSYTGLQNFPANSIASTSINNTTFVDLSSNQIISNKQFSGTTIFSSIQLNSDLITSNGSVTILNSNMALVNFLSGTSSNINTRFTTNETNITALQTKTTNMSFGSNITTFTGTMVFPIASISFNAIVGTACTLGQNQTITGTKTFSSVQNFTSNLRLDGSLLVGVNGNVVLTNSTIQKVAFISDVTSAVGANLTSLQNSINSINTNLGNYVTETELSTALSPINTDISTLNTKTQYISSTSLNTTILNTTNVADLLISLTINGFSKGDFNNVITQCSSLTSNCQNQINDAISKTNSAQNKADSAYNLASGAQATASSAFALAGTAQATGAGALALAGTAQTSANTANSGLATLNTTVDGIEVDVTELQVKTTQISYSPATGRTSVNDTIYCPYLEIGNLESGINQTSTDQITLAGVLRCNNRVEINNTLELLNNNNIIVEGIINQDNATPPNAGVNQFLAPTNFNGNVIITNTTTSINSTTTQIGTNAISTLNCNATAEFGGDITMLTNKNLRLKNIVPILLDSIYFGGEAGVHLNDDVVFNMKIEANRPLQINNTCQIGTTINRNTLTSYTTTNILDANTGMTLTSPVIGITSPSITIGQNGVTAITLNGSIVQIGQTLGINYLYGTTYVQNLYSTTGVIGAVGNVFQQFV